MTLPHRMKIWFIPPNLLSPLSSSISFLLFSSLPFCHRQRTAATKHSIAQLQTRWIRKEGFYYSVFYLKLVSRLFVAANNFSQSFCAAKARLYLKLSESTAI